MHLVALRSLTKRLVEFITLPSFHVFFAAKPHTLK
jgi:hypothetical protein